MRTGTGLIAEFPGRDGFCDPFRTRQGAVGTEMSAEEVFEREITVGNTMGLHARPAAQLVRIASSFDASMSVEKVGDGEDGEADCRSVLSLLMLAAGKGTRLILRTSGPQAEAAFKAAVKFFESNFGEDE